jgi:ATP-dependent Clp protease ATP-binding subunit ClpX
VEKRLGRNDIGFHGDRQRQVRRTTSELLAEVLPEDLVVFGMIPEFVGRLPMITSVEELGRTALLRVLTEPKNALVRQYRTLFQFDGIELDFRPGALEAVADQAIERGTGARGLRSILDAVLISVMYDVPSLTEVTRVAVTKETITRGVPPILYTASGEVYDWEEDSATA